MKFQKTDYANGSENRRKPATAPVTRKFCAEVEELKLGTKATALVVLGTGQENVHKSRHKAKKEVEEEINPGRKMSILSRRRREDRTSATGVLGTNLFSVSSRADRTPCRKGFADAVKKRCSPSEKAKKKTEDGAW